MTDDKEAVKHAEGNRWHGEEIHGRNRFPMVSKEGQPALGPVRISRRSFHPTGDGSLGKIKTKHAEFPMDPRRATPEKLIEEAENRVRLSTLQRDELLTQSEIPKKETSPPTKEADQHSEAEPDEGATWSG